jgi:DNA-binding transcriptional regulator YiaG
MTLADLTARAAARRGLPPPPVRRDIRRMAGVSMADLADALGVSTASVSLWETGRRTPRHAHLLAYSEALSALQAACAGTAA